MSKNLTETEKATKMSIKKYEGIVEKTDRSSKSRPADTDRRTVLKTVAALGVSLPVAHAIAAQAAAIDANQAELRQRVSDQYDYIVCGSGSSGSVIASRLSENPGNRVLLIEAGGTDQVSAILEPALWFTNLGSERDWGHKSTPQEHLNGRVVPLSMGKALGGGSSINVMLYARGHKNDWDYWAEQSKDASWGYEHVLGIYRRIENWQGVGNPKLRGSGGNVWVQPAADPNPIAPAMMRSAAALGIPSFADQNGEMMEGPGGCAITNTTIKAGRRVNMPAQYLTQALARPNLTVLTQAEVRKVSLHGTVATGVEVIWRGKALRIAARREVILSMGALNTPKVLMLSGIGDEPVLRRAGIKPVHQLPGVGRNYMDHLLLSGCIWEYVNPIAPRHLIGECTLFWKSRAALETPDLQPVQIEIPLTSPEVARDYTIPPASWTIAPGLVRPESRGRVTLRSADPSAPLRIEANSLSEPADMEALIRGVELVRDIGNGPEMREFAKREVMPGPLSRPALENFIRNSAMTYWHQTGTCRMGTDDTAVVDARLRVHGIQKLRIADGSIMPRVTTGNTMAPCMIIGERLSEMLKD